jgi:hypothetical protein
VKQHLTNGKGPGPRKAQRHPVASSRTVEVWKCADYRWRELFEAADVMSEGAVRHELEGPTYYGTTSVLLPFTSRGGLVPDELARDVARLASKDPHVRVRALRIAWREASVRSVHPIGRMRAEFVVRPDTRGIRVDIDVEAKVLGAAASSTRTRAR